jgi:gluconokinase
MKDPSSPPKVIVLMGVAGSGKTTVGIKLAQELGWEFYDADQFHSEENIEKMARGIPLTDADRWPWLDRLHNLILDRLKKDRPAVLACSTLKKVYQERLLRDTRRATLVFLRGGFDLIYERLQERQDHYMEAGMLESQFAALEEPEEALAVEIESAPNEIAEEIVRRLGLEGREA